MGKKSAHFKEYLVETMDIPRDLAYREPLVTVTGNTRLCIENYKSILEYTPTKLLLATGPGKLKIHGSGLKIVSYTNDEMRISGHIAEILFIN